MKEETQSHIHVTRVRLSNAIYKYGPWIKLVSLIYPAKLVFSLNNSTKAL